MKSKVGDTAMEEDFAAKNREYEKRIEAGFDQDFPEVAAYVQNFVDSAIKDIDEAKQAAPELKMGLDKIKELLSNFLKMQKDQLLKTGETNSLLGWGLPDSGAFVALDFNLTAAKYRVARAVSEIAGKVNAPYIVYVGEGWWREPKDLERTGDEVVMAYVILPDGSVTTSGQFSFRRIDCPLAIKEDIEIHQSKGQRLEQTLFPAWAYIPPENETVAA